MANRQIITTSKHIRRAAHIVIGVILCMAILFAALVVSVKTTQISDQVAGIPIDMSINFTKNIVIDCGAPGELVLDPEVGLINPFGATIKINNVWPDSALESFISGDAAALSGSKIGELIVYFTEESGRLARALLINLMLRFAIMSAGGILVLASLFFSLKRIRWTRRRAIRMAASVITVCLIVSAMTAGLLVLDSAPQDEYEEGAYLSGFSIDTSIGVLTFRGVLSVPARKINDIVVTTDLRGRIFSQKAEAAVPEALAGFGYRQLDDEVLMMHITDIHDNLYMYPVVAAIAKETGASVVLDTGDVTKTGSSLEGAFVNNYVGTMLDAGIKEFYYIRGNHDTKTTDNQMKAAGAIVLSDIQDTESGLVIAGFGDPLHTDLATSIHTSERSKLLDEQNTLIYDKLSEYEKKNKRRVNILMTHSPSTGKKAREAGLLDIQLSGHEHIAAPRISPMAPTSGAVMTEEQTGTETQTETTTTSAQDTWTDTQPEATTTAAQDTWSGQLSYLIEGNNANGETNSGQNEMFGTAVGPIRRSVTIVMIKWNKISDSYRYYTVKITPAGKVSASEVSPLPSLPEATEE